MQRGDSRVPRRGTAEGSGEGDDEDDVGEDENGDGDKADEDESANCRVTEIGSATGSANIRSMPLWELAWGKGAWPEVVRKEGRTGGGNIYTSPQYTH